MLFPYLMFLLSALIFLASLGALAYMYSKGWLTDGGAISYSAPLWLVPIMFSAFGMFIWYQNINYVLPFSR